MVEFFKCWKYPSNSSETFKILFFHQNNQFEAKTACFADFSILTKIAVSGPYRRGNFVGWFFWLSFSNVENTLRILLKHSKFCSFIKTISLKQKQHVLRTFQFWPKSLYPDLTGVAIFWLIFLVEFFKCWKYPSNSSETFKILFFHQNNQFEAKTACFADFSILTKIAVSGPYRRGHFLVDFFGWVFQMLKIPFEFFWNIQNFVLSSKQSVWSKNSMFCGLFNFDQNRCIRTLPAWPFFGWFFWLSFSNVENTLRILLKHSKFCSFIKTISLKQKQHVLRTFQFWPKSLYPDLTGVAILLVDFFFEFFKCWKYPSNSSETFKILFFHQNNQFEAKTACFADFSILTKIAVSGPYRRGNFVGWFFWLSFSNVENTLRILLKHSKFCSFIKTISLKQKQHVLRTFQFWPKSLYPDLTGVAILLVDFFGWVFQMLKIPFEFFWNIQNFVLSSKQSVWSKNSMFCGLFNFDQNRCIRTLPAWPFFSWFFWLSFSNVENTLRILLKHSKFCSFIKTISLKQKQHVLRTFQFWPKSLYPDLTGVAILLVDFFGWVFQMLKIPFEFFWNIQNFVLSSKQSVWSKNSMFCGLFNFDQNRCIRTLPAWQFCWLIFWLSFSNVENTLRILLKHSKFCSFIKTISLKQKQHVLRTFQFWPKSLYPDLTGVAILLVDFFGWVFQMLKIPFEFFWNIQNFVLSSKQSVWSKNSMFCGLFNFDQNRCIRTLPAWPFCWLIFLVEFFKCWKYPSNSSETFKILFFHQNNQFEAKTACFADFSILTKIAVSGPYRRGHFVGWFFWLIFWNVENTLRILLKHSKFCSFIKTISLKQKQHVLRTFQFWPKSLYPDLTGVAILLVDFFGWVFQMLKIPFEFFWNIQNFVLSSKQSVWSKNSMFCGLFNFDQNRCIRTLPAWPFFWLIFLVEFFKCWKYPSNSSETFKILFFHQNNQFEAKTACFADFSILTKIAVSGPYRRGIFLVEFFKCWKYPSNSSETFKILFFHQNNQFEAKTACFADFSILTKIAVSGPYRRGHFLVDFLVEFFKCWKYPSNSSETFKILFFHQNNQFEAKTACFADFSILTKIAVSGPYRRGHFVGWFFWLSFSNVENTLRILLKHSKFCSFIKTISLRQKQHVLRTFQFWPKSLYPDLTGVAIFWLIFLVEFFKCWKYPSNSSETFKILFFHQNNQFEAKTACFADFSILTKIAVSGPYRRGNFVGWFFWLSFSNVENTLRILLKHSKFCSFIKTISLKQKQHVLRTFQFWPKSLYPDLTSVAFCWLIFLVEFFKCWKYPSNSSETFKILFFHQNNQFEAKTACFADFSILTKIAVSGPYRRDHFVGWFFLLSFSNVENTLRILLKHSKFCSFIKTISLKQKQHVLRTFQFWPKSLYPDLTGVAIFLVDFFLSFSNVENTLRILLKHSKFCSFIKTISLKQKQHVLRTFQFWPKSLYPDLTGVAILLVDFFGWVFQMLKIPFEFFWNIQNFVLSSKQSVWSKNSMFCGLFNFDQNRCIRTLPAWQFCWLIFLVEFFKCWKYPSNSSETFKILFFHQNNQFEAKTACFADFSILTKIAVSGPYRVAIFLVDFFGWVFQMLKIPFEFFWNIQNFVLSSKQSVWSKNSMFCGLFNFDQNRCIRTLPAWPFCRLIFLVEFFKCWKYPSNSSETFKILFFHQNNQFEAKTACFADFSILTKIAVSGPYRRGHFFGWFFWLSFSNVENNLQILLKHSKFCSFIKTISLMQKQHVLRTFQFWPKSLYPDLTGVAILLVDFFCWVFQMMKIPF